MNLMKKQTNLEIAENSTHINEIVFVDDDDLFYIITF